MRRTERCIVTLVVGLAGASAERAAHGEPPHDQAAALELFNRAKELQAADDWAGACTKFEASMALNPAVGTQTRIARCNVHRGKLARAWSDYLGALSLNRSASGQSIERTEELRLLIEKELAALAPRVPRLRVVIRNPPPQLHVFRDGSPFPQAALGESLPVDPGKIEISVEAPGCVPVQRQVTAIEGEEALVEIVLQSVLPPPALGPTAISTPQSDVPMARSAPSIRLGQRRVAALILGGAGVVGIGIAVGLGVDALNKASSASPYCTPDEKCRPTGLGLLTSAREAQTGAFVSLAIGTALTTTGIALWFTAPSTPAPRPNVTLGPGTVTFRTVW